MYPIQLLEGVGVALGALRTNKLRAALTVLGVAIGVMVVMVIAAIITGINRNVAAMFEESGTRTFFVTRYFEGGVHIDDGTERRRRPNLTVAEAKRLETRPAIAYLDVQEWYRGPAEWNGQRLESTSIQGRWAPWPNVSGGDVYPGRSFTRLEEYTSARVAVINDKLAERLFGRLDPVGRRIRLRSQPFQVIGVYTGPPNLFGEEDGPRAIIPHASLQKYIKPFEGSMRFTVKAADSVLLVDAIDDVTVALRTMRGLRPAEENNFDVVTQDKLIDTWNQVTRVFFLVMIVLSGVGLMVGGVGVVAIMMISVTERTREIGVRKALGATKREILWQFLVEAATVTLVGGAAGMVLGGLVAFVVASATPLPAAVPLWSVVVALAAAILTGIVFGMYPAARAARLDPVEALRYE